MRYINDAIILLLITISFTACEKLVTVGDPIDTITTTQMFRSDAQAQAALGGLYSVMINNKDYDGNALGQFSNGQMTILGGLSADELNSFKPTQELLDFNTNRLRFDNPYPPAIWNSAYKSIYGANAIIEGVAASTSPSFSDEGRKRISGEAKFIRAFSYFYLVNLFGDVPLPLTVDFNETRNYARTPVEKVYEQILKDLLVAQADLPPVNTNPAGERIYPDKWAATALLSRVYLYLKDYRNAYKQADAVIKNMAGHQIEMDIDKVFLKESREAIWQLKQNSDALFYNVGNATPEAYLLIPTPGFMGEEFYYLSYSISDQLLASFEPGDKRLTHWIGRSEYDLDLPKEYYFPYKYKTGMHNRVIGGAPTEFYTALRLAEQYLIRAEAAAYGEAALTDAIDDLNELRNRAGLIDLPYTLSQSQVIDAIAQERRVELFCEWGHRWFDLKRTGKAAAYLSQLPGKQPWRGDYQLLYPIPAQEILFNPNLKPNPGYN